MPKQIVLPFPPVVPKPSSTPQTAIELPARKAA